MVPAILPGDTVNVALGRSPRLGDVVVRVDGERPVVHRVVGERRHRDVTVWITKGDNGRGFDPPCPEEALAGVVAGIVRGGRSCRYSGRILGRCLAIIGRHVAGGIAETDAAGGSEISADGELPRFVWLWKGLYQLCSRLHGWAVAVTLWAAPRFSDERRSEGPSV